MSAFFATLSPATVSTTRRGMLLGSAALIAAPNLSAQPANAASSLRVVQLLDMSATQQQLSRDYATGFRVAWSEGARRAGSVVLQRVDTDGSDAAIDSALDSARSDQGVLALVGAAGEALALRVGTRLRDGGAALAHLAPWLPDTRLDGERALLPLFASREQQIRRALKALGGMGLRELQIVYASEAQAAALQASLQQATQGLGLVLQGATARAGEDMAALGQRLARSTVSARVFLGGPIEMALLTRGLGAAGDRRFLVGLADVDVDTLQQVGIDARVPLVLVQPVPNVQRSPLRVAGDYRAGLQKLFDEPPSAFGLAGFAAARATLALLGRSGTAPTRDSVIGEAARRSDVDVGGLRFAFADRRRGSEFVNLVLLERGGQLVG